LQETTAFSPGKQETKNPKTSRQSTRPAQESSKALFLFPVSQSSALCSFDIPAFSFRTATSLPQTSKTPKTSRKSTRSSKLNDSPKKHCFSFLSSRQHYFVIQLSSIPRMTSHGPLSLSSRPFFSLSVFRRDPPTPKTKKERRERKKHWRNQQIPTKRSETDRNPRKDQRKSLEIANSAEKQREMHENGRGES
jgi:hypothetical protein